MKSRKQRVSRPSDEPLTGKKKRINWQGWALYEIVEILNELKEVGETPTIRGVWYILVSKHPEYIPNTKGVYQSYDDATVKARERQPAYPVIAEDAFADDTRFIIGIDNDAFTLGADVADVSIENVKEIGSKYYIPRWYKQQNYCEFWVEKRAITKMFITILRKDDVDRQVRIVPNSGWTSFTYVKKNIERLYQHWNDKSEELETILFDKTTYPHIWVFYNGDCDPSGRKMDINLVIELMSNFRKRFRNAVMSDERIPDDEKEGEISRRMSTIHFMRIAIMVNQIPEFNLEGLTDPDAETLLKLEGGIDPKTGKPKKGDPNTEWFKKMFWWYKGGKVFQIEIDAMYARREQFKKLLLDLIDSKFDEEIHKEHVENKLAVERDALTMRLQDKLVNEKIELPGWDRIEDRMSAFKSIFLRMAENSFLMNLTFATLFSAINNSKPKSDETRGERS